MTKRLTKWQRWFFALQPGDRVQMLFPWDDSTRRGGALRTATVAKCRSTQGKLFRFRNRFGTRHSAFLYSWQGDCYHHVLPFGYELRYGPKRGYWLRRSK